MSESLRISEIFYSLQGETKTVGLPTVFVRLTGCPLRCNYCDSAYAFSGGTMMSLEAIEAEVAQYNPSYITVSGGEPLSQPNCLTLLNRLCDAYPNVSIETSGALDIQNIDARVSIVMDLKTPSSTEVEKNRYQNIEHLQNKDQVKFVIADKADYDWSKSKLLQYNLSQRVHEVLFSPSHTTLEPKALAEWILKDNLPVRLQIQMHKYLWGDVAGH